MVFSWFSKKLTKQIIECSKFASYFPAKEQLEKSRDIIKRLQEDKKRVMQEAREKVEKAEQNFDEERQSFIQDLSRGKAEAIKLLKVSIQPFIRCPLKWLGFQKRAKIFK